MRVLTGRWTIAPLFAMWLNRVLQPAHSYRSQHVWKTVTPLRRWIVAGLVACASLSGNARAQTVARCDNLTALGPGTEMRVTQQKGRAIVDIARSGHAGGNVDIEYGDEIYSQKFDSDGRVHLGFGLTAPDNTITIEMTESRPFECLLAVPEFANIYRVILRWHDPVLFDLNVLEPGARMNEPGHINSARPNTDLSRGIGQIDLSDGIPTDGSTSEISYAVPNLAAIPANGAFTYRLDYVTRGAQPDAPYCGDAPLAAAKFDFITIEDGMATVRKMTTNRAHCGERIPDAKRLIPIRQ